MSRHRVRARLALGVAAVLVLAAGTLTLWLRHHDRDQEWAHGGDRVSAHAQIEATGVAQFGDALAAAGVPREPGMSQARQMFVVRVSWSGTPAGGGDYQFILLDDRLQPAKPIHAYGVWGQGMATGPNWASAYDTLAERYPWLARTASQGNASEGWTNDTEALGLPATPTGEGTLAFWLGKGELPTTQPDRHLVLAMAFVDADGEVRWARKVPLLQDT